jgi:hypothetical protein
MENLHLKNLKNNGKITIKKITRYFDKQHIQIFPNENGYQKARNFIGYVYPPPQPTKIQEWVNNQTVIIYYNYYYEKQPEIII